MYYDDDDMTHLGSMPAKSWESAMIETYRDGNWLMFTDKRTNEQLNGPRTHHVDYKVSYHYKGYRPQEPPPRPNPLDIPVIDNYTAFRVRKRIYGPRGVQSARTRAIPNEGLRIAKDQSTKYFRGDDPSRNPFRVSNKVVYERRMKEMQPREPEKPRQVTTARKIPSLFERSLVRKKVSLWPPDDYYGWTGEQC